jgi:D-alanyl-D-alanine carboxypeptidase
MKQEANKHNVDRYKPRRQSRRKKRFRRIPIFLFLCCLVITVTAFGLIKNKDPLGKEEWQMPPITAINTNMTASNTRSEETPWNLILVNKWNSIPDDYEVELMELTNGQLVDKRIYPELQEMFDAARSENIYPIAGSGYRTEKKQKSLMKEKVAEYKAKGLSQGEARAKAEAWVAVPGTSEHQIGLSIDINADRTQSTGNDVYEWLRKNSYKFGFILRYPADKTDITGVINEPWHYRYVGKEAAAQIYKRGICLEEYLNKTNE